MNLPLVRRLATVLLFVAIPSLPVRPQNVKPNSNPEERSRKIKPEIKKAQYERPSYEGGGSTTTYPFEKWFYRNIPNVRSGVDLEYWHDLNDSGQRLTLARLIDTRMLTPGDYQIQVRLHDQITGQALSPVAKFTILPQILNGQQ